MKILKYKRFMKGFIQWHKTPVGAAPIGDHEGHILDRVLMNPNSVT